MRSAILKDVAHSDLESALGNHLETGWTIKDLIPTSWYESGTMTGGVRVRNVTHWTVVLEHPLMSRAAAAAAGIETR